ncbi:GumC domain-containing protein [Algoriphagus mannitolivorans]|uniref:hypothetical protein n=1 Tax=Algoriphagus mannitolivorans TaxID=226504 RepID=UPI000417AD93|nr:hypothetical protein [Algoriphagus mannitolivorans]
MKKTSREILGKPEINLIELGEYFYFRRKIVFWSILVMLSLGTARSIFSPKLYEATSIKLSEEETSGQFGLGQLGALAGFSGINFQSPNQTGSISPEMYPEILESKPFLIDLVHEKFYFESQKDSLTLEEYLVEDYSSKPFNIIMGAIMGFPSKIGTLFSSKEPQISPIVQSALEEKGSSSYLRITPEEDLASELLKAHIKIEDEGNMITLSTKMPEPLIAAELNNIIFEKIVKYVTDYKTRKLRINLEFIEERTKEAEDKFINAQIALASFRDSNQGIISQRARSREEQLLAEFNIAFNLYNSMMQELETSRIQLKKETPVFSEFASPIVPNNPTQTPYWKSFIIFTFLGVIVGVGIIIFQMAREYFKPLFKTA